MMINLYFLEYVSNSNDIKYHDGFLKEHHEVFVTGVAHAFWWRGDDDVCRLNLHLDAHDHSDAPNWT